MKSITVVLICIFIITIFKLTLATLSASDRSTGKQSKLAAKSGPTDKTLEERGLISATPKIKDIIREHNAYTITTVGLKNTNGSVLGYVTPWNSRGYDIAKIFAKKFTHISPVWLQIKMNDDHESVRIEGTHDIDYQWMKSVRAVNPDIKIVPRVMFDSWSPTDLSALMQEPRMPGIIGRTLVDTATKYEFDGFVLEMWNAFAVQQRDQVVQLIAKVYAHFKKAKLLLILVVPPPIHHGSRAGLVTRGDVERLAPYVHGFSVMTYDYSTIQRPGPNSPIDWIRECVKTLAPKPTSPIRPKLFMGMNMYGMDYTPNGGGPIVGSQYAEIVEKYKPKLVWDETSVEHYLEYKSGPGRNRIFYPSLLSIQRRIQLFNSLGVSISIWDLGQGLDYFYDLF